MDYLGFPALQVPLPPSTTSLLLESPEGESPARSNGTVTPNATGASSLSARRKIGFTLSGAPHNPAPPLVLHINPAAANSLPQLSPALSSPSRFIELLDFALDTSHDHLEPSPHPRHVNNINIHSPRSPPPTMPSLALPPPPTPPRLRKTSTIGKVWRRASIILRRANTKNTHPVPLTPDSDVQATPPSFPIRAATLPLPRTPISPFSPRIVQSDASPELDVDEFDPNDGALVSKHSALSLQSPPPDSITDMSSMPTDPSSPSMATRSSSDSKSISTATSIYSRESSLSPPPFDTLLPLRLANPTSPNSPNPKSPISLSKRKTIFRRSTVSPASGFSSIFPKSPTREDSNEPPRSPMSVTMHTPGSIGLQTGKIEDDEMRRLSEAAFM